MFVALELKNNEESRFSALKNVMSRSSAELQKVKIENAAPFYVVTINNSKHIPWKKLSYNLGRLTNKLLVPHNIEIPEDMGVKSITITDELHAISLLNTASKIAKYSGIPARKLKLSIVDRDGVYLKNIERIINCASHIKVITNNFRKYQPVVDYMFNYWGASIFLTDDLQTALNSHIIISPYEEIVGTNALILTLDKCRSLTCNTAIATKLMLPHSYLEYLPFGADEHDFASVLYDEYKFKSLSNISLDKMIINGSEKSVYEMSKLMDSQYSFT